MAYGPQCAARLAAIAAALVTGVAALPGPATAATHAALPGRAAPRATRHEVTYFYGSGASNMFDAYWYDTTTPRPGIMLIHGGDWVGGDKGDLDGTARWYADRGFVVFSANYRLAQNDPWPAQRTDALAAIDYVDRHAAQFGLDPDRLAVLGSAAGGQIAADAGTYGSAAVRIRGVAALSPVLAPYQAYLDGAARGASEQSRKLSRTAELLAACPPGPMRACWDTWSAMTPKNRASAGDVPMLLAYSRRDPVSPTEGIGLRDALRAYGLSATLTVLPGAADGDALLRTPGMRERLLRFFTRVTRARMGTIRPAPPHTSTPTPRTPTPPRSPRPLLPTTLPTLPTPSLPGVASPSHR